MRGREREALDRGGHRVFFVDMISRPDEDKPYTESDGLKASEFWQKNSRKYVSRKVTMRPASTVAFLSACAAAGLLLTRLCLADYAVTANTATLTLKLRDVPAPFRFSSYCAPTSEVLWTVGGMGEVLLMRSDQPTRRFYLGGHLSKEGLYGAFFDDQGRGWVVGQAGSIFYTADWGNTWVRQLAKGRDDLSAIACADYKTCWAVGDHGLAVRTTNAGKEWKVLKTGSSVDFNAVEFINSDVGWIVGDDGVVLHTVDGGGSWTTQHVAFTPDPAFNQPERTLRAVKFINRDVGWIASSDEVARTNDGGMTWKLSSVADDDDLLSLVGLVSKDGEKVWAINEGANNYCSNDRGVTWHACGSGDDETK